MRIAVFLLLLLTMLRRWDAPRSAVAPRQPSSSSAWIAYSHAATVLICGPDDAAISDADVKLEADHLPPLTVSTFTYTSIGCRYETDLVVTLVATAGGTGLEPPRVNITLSHGTFQAAIRIAGLGTTTPMGSRSSIVINGALVVGSLTIRDFVFVAESTPLDEPQPGGGAAGNTPQRAIVRVDTGSLGLVTVVGIVCRSLGCQGVSLKGLTVSERGVRISNCRFDQDEESAASIARPASPSSSTDDHHAIVMQDHTGGGITLEDTTLSASSVLFRNCTFTHSLTFNGVTMANATIVTLDAVSVRSYGVTAFYIYSTSIMDLSRLLLQQSLFRVTWSGVTGVSPTEGQGISFHESLIGKGSSLEIDNVRIETQTFNCGLLFTKTVFNGSLVRLSSVVIIGSGTQGSASVLLGQSSAFLQSQLIVTNATIERQISIFELAASAAILTDGPGSRIGDIEFSCSIVSPDVRADVVTKLVESCLRSVTLTGCRLPRHAELTFTTSSASSAVVLSLINPKVAVGGSLSISDGSLGAVVWSGVVLERYFVSYRRCQFVQSCVFNDVTLRAHSTILLDHVRASVRGENALTFRRLRSFDASTILVANSTLEVAWNSDVGVSSTANQGIVFSDSMLAARSTVYFCGVRIIASRANCGLLFSSTVLDSTDVLMDGVVVTAGGERGAASVLVQLPSVLTNGSLISISNSSIRGGLRVEAMSGASRFIVTDGAASQLDDIAISIRPGWDNETEIMRPSILQQLVASASSSVRISGCRLPRRTTLTFRSTASLVFDAPLTVPGGSLTIKDSSGGMSFLNAILQEFSIVYRNCSFSRTVTFDGTTFANGSTFIVDGVDVRVRGDNTMFISNTQLDSGCQFAIVNSSFEVTWSGNLGPGLTSPHGILLVALSLAGDATLTIGGGVSIKTVSDWNCGINFFSGRMTGNAQLRLTDVTLSGSGGQGSAALFIAPDVILANASIRIVQTTMSSFFGSVGQPDGQLLVTMAKATITGAFILKIAPAVASQFTGSATVAVADDCAVSSLQVTSATVLHRESGSDILAAAALDAVRTLMTINSLIASSTSQDGANEPLTYSGIEFGNQTTCRYQLLVMSETTSNSPSRSIYRRRQRTQFTPERVEGALHGAKSCVDRLDGPLHGAKPCVTASTARSTEPTLFAPSATRGRCTPPRSCTSRWRTPSRRSSLD